MRMGVVLMVPFEPWACLEPSERTVLRGFYLRQQPHSFFMASIHDIHIGRLILQQMKIQHVSYADLGKALHLDRSTIYHMTRQKSVDSERLYHLSRILQFDFYNTTYGCVLNELSPALNLGCKKNVDIKQLVEILSNLPDSSNITINIQISSITSSRQVLAMADQKPL